MSTNTDTGLGTVRHELAAALSPLSDTARGAELAATIYPEPVTAPMLPAVVIEAADPWGSADYLGGTHVVRFECRVVTRSITSGGSFSTCERLTSDALAVLTGRCNVEGWTAPFAVKAGDASALACRITVSIPARITSGGL